MKRLPAAARQAIFLGATEPPRCPTEIRRRGPCPRTPMPRVAWPRRPIRSPQRPRSARELPAAPQCPDRSSLVSKSRPLSRSNLRNRVLFTHPTSKIPLNARRCCYNRGYKILDSIFPKARFEAEAQPYFIDDLGVKYKRFAMVKKGALLCLLCLLCLWCLDAPRCHSWAWRIGRTSIGDVHNRCRRPNSDVLAFLIG
jgi:hypothetical protein